MAGYEETFRELEARGVRYVVVGGLAVVLRGHVRATIDLDLAVDFASTNATRLVEALTRAGFVPSAPVAPEALADPSARAGWIEEKNAKVASWHHEREPLLVVDVLLAPAVAFERLWSGAQRLPYRGVRIPVASIGDLVELKRAAGRIQDLADVERLESLPRPEEDGG